MAALDYVTILRELLRPVGIYDVDEGLGAAELEAIGKALNRAYNDLCSAELEANPLTAGNTGLSAWESLLPFVPVYRSLEDRRRAVAALLRVDGASFTLAGINDAIAGCGIHAVVAESEKPQTVGVYFPDTRGEPDEFEALKKRIERLLPCHLAVEYLLVYVRWYEMEALFPLWYQTESDSLSWRELERLGSNGEAQA